MDGEMAAGTVDSRLRRLTTAPLDNPAGCPQPLDGPYGPDHTDHSDGDD